MRTFAGIFIGLLLAAGVLYGCGYALVRLQPLPADFDPLSMTALSEYVMRAPRGAQALLACACGLAALVGGWAAARIARGQRGPAALWIGAPLTVLVLASAALVRQPDWIPVLGMLLPIPLAVAAWRLAIPRAEL